MAAPSKNFTSIPDASVDADSPLDTTLFTQIRDSLVHLEEWLGMSYTAAQDHSHNGTDSALVSSIADGAVSTAAKLAASVVTGAKISKTIVSNTNQYLPATTSWTPAAGVYQTADQGGVQFQLFDTVSWKGNVSATGLYFCDGTNMRFYAPSNSYLWYHTF